LAFLELDLAEACLSFKNLLLTRCLEIFCDRLLERRFIFCDQARHAIELLDPPRVSSRYPAGKVELLQLENGLESIHDRASARVIPFRLLDASAVIPERLRREFSDDVMLNCFNGSAHMFLSFL